MRIRILSDLHGNFGFYESCDEDLIILAGDIDERAKGIDWAATLPHPVIYILGNHEYYSQPYDFGEFHTVLCEYARDNTSNVQVLEKESISIEGIQFLGTTLWTDYKLYGIENEGGSRRAAQFYMNDFRYIRGLDSSYRASQAFEESINWLSQQNYDLPTVVITHHTPSERCLTNPQFQNDPLNPAFASNLDSFILEKQPLVWIAGHTHMGFDFQLGKTRVIGNPQGYRHEIHSSGFRKDLLVEL